MFDSLTGALEITSSVHRRNLGSSQEASAQARECVGPGFYWAIYRKEARQWGTGVEWGEDKQFRIV